MKFQKHKKLDIPAKECFDFDKYGRILVKVYNIDDVSLSINDIMINEGHGKIYDGGKKDTNWQISQYFIHYNKL